MPTLRLLILAASLVASSALAQNCPTRPSWPTTEWPVNLGPATATPDEVAALEDFAVNLVGEPAQRRGLRTNALLVVKSGTIVYERYARGFGPNNRHMVHSVSKVFSSALIGVAKHQGLIDIEDSVCKYLTRYEGNTTVCDIKVKHFLTHSSGLQWQEATENQGAREFNSMGAMYFGMGHRDWLAFVLGHRKRADPGTQTVYSTGDATVVGTVAKVVLDARFGKDAFWTQFFDVIGMRSLIFEEDVAGNVAGGSWALATPRDFARFGYLYLNDGCWAGQRLLAESWVRDSTRMSDAYALDRGACREVPARPCEAWAFGYMCGLNVPPRPGAVRPYPDAPADLFLGIGHLGQYTIVIPSEDVVIVRTGDDRNWVLNAKHLVKFSLPLTR